MSFDSLCALEYMAMADRENVQTGLLAWLLGANSPLPLMRRAKILSSLSGRTLPPVKEIKTRTETSDIDLVATCLLLDGTQTSIAIENKLKAVESTTQLDQYDKRLRGIPVHAKVFLSLLGDEPRGGSGWIPATYAQLLSALDAEADDRTREDPYVRDARAMLRRLVDAVTFVAGDPRFASYVFHASAKQPSVEESTFRSYVRTLRLRRFLQRAWCVRVGRELGSLGTGWSISTGMGARSASAHLQVARIVGTGEEAIRTGLQLENLVLRAFCHPHPYPKVATLAQNATVKKRLVQVVTALALDPRRHPTKAKKRGFRSFVLEGRVSTIPPDPEVWATTILKYYKQLEVAAW